jgi:integrase
MYGNAHLWSICTDHYFKTRIKLRSEKTRTQYRLAVNNLSSLLGRPAVLTDLTDDNLAMLCHLLLDEELSPYTVNERVGRLKSVWTWAAKKGFLSTFPTLERVPVEELIPRAWSVAELRALFDSCANEPGTIAGIPARDWWLALHSWLWCTSERKGATFALRWEMVDLEGMTAAVPGAIRKGRKGRVYDLWPECCSMLRTIWEPRREMVFPWPYNDGTYYNHYARILRRAGLSDGRKNKTHAMRVTHASWRQATGGNAAAALGHASPATTQKHYLDPRIVKNESQPLFSPMAAN